MARLPSKFNRNFVTFQTRALSDSDKIGGIIEEARPHHAVIRRWRKLKFEMEGDLNDALKIINNKETREITTLKPQNTRGA